MGWGYVGVVLAMALLLLRLADRPSTRVLGPASVTDSSMVRHTSGV